MQRRLARLDEFGEQTQLWASMLKTVISRFLGAFNANEEDDEDDEDDADDEDEEDGEDDVPGDEDYGEQTVLKREASDSSEEEDVEDNDDFWGYIASPINMGSSGRPTLGGWLTAFCAFTERGISRGPERNNHYGWGFDVEQRYELDGVSYPIIYQEDIPAGSVEVDLKIIDRNRIEFQTVMMAGNMGLKVTESGSGELDMVQNAPMWAVFLKTEKRISRP
jgi:Domain of unknown function (DUF4419)